jgi:hypothetical protein
VGLSGATTTKESKMEIDYIYIDENGLTVTRLKPQKTVEEYRAHTARYGVFRIPQGCCKMGKSGQ